MLVFITISLPSHFLQILFPFMCPSVISAVCDLFRRAGTSFSKLFSRRVPSHVGYSPATVMVVAPSVDGRSIVTLGRVYDVFVISTLVRASISTHISLQCINLKHVVSLNEAWCHPLLVTIRRMEKLCGETVFFCPKQNKPAGL